MSDPVISIIAPAIRTQFWLELYGMCCAGNTVPFEIVYVGYVRPDFALPENFIYIYSEAKPPQCFEIAWRNAKGEFILIITDDLVVTPGTIDGMYNYIMRLWNEKVVVSARFADSLTGPILDSLFCFNIFDPESPVLGCATLSRKRFWKELGGIDRRFNRLWSDTDLQMRFLAAGGHAFVVPSEEHVMRERPHDYPRLVGDLSKGKPADKVLLDSLWTNPDGSTSRTRLSPVESYSDDEIPIVR